MTTFKTWKEKPTELEVQNVVEDFFAYLKKGELDNAKNSVDHLYDDWEESIHVIWRDHYLIHETAQDESFEGREWINNLEWTQNLGILDDFMWGEEKGSSRYLDVSVTYMEEPSGFAAQFYLVKNDDHYVVKRGLIDMA
ncbi:hypothetical protein [Flavobacterium reichenbachii]|uniref:SnoaL-like domain-containing protein n=1 Tax=Flavobacterium reichenbachii TaxID=362418 RepID=A0A085ZIR5_9FLAO|nr:hypothetical protein [Flavobacterium reichenbachii]KFF04329.1 hypothetical protein IW19_01760 [Flavobacterium reichenbachii]OXB11682.1 hypothetical protein B0A68_20800 [Flavobacterium reichenbachii]